MFVSRKLKHRSCRVYKGRGGACEGTPIQRVAQLHATLRLLLSAFSIVVTFRGCGPWAKFFFDDPCFLAEDFMMTLAVGNDTWAALDVDMEESLYDVLVEIGDLAPPKKDSTKVEIPWTFEFGTFSTTFEDQEKYSGLGWFARNIARHSEGEVVPKPNFNETVIL